MMDLWNLLFKGISLGTIYALSAMGFVLIFKTGKVINLAHGQLMAMGAFLFILLSSLPGITLITVFSLTILISLVMLFVTERLFIRPLSPIDLKRCIFMTLGIMLMVKGLIASVSLPPSENISTIPDNSSIQVFILFAGILSVLIFLLFFRRSSLGLYIRAVSDNRKAALSLGIPIERLFTFSWVIAGMAAVISGILLAIGSGLNAAYLVSMEAGIFPALVLGGLGSMRGAILGGLLIGILETCAGGQASGPLRELFPYMILILILLIRPYGLFSDKVDLPGIKG